MLKSLFSKIFFPAILLLALTLSGNSPATAGNGRPAGVPWPQLPYYLEQLGVSLDRNLSLCDCPSGINEESPSHHIIQIIANTLYEWREYQFTDAAGQPSLALIMNHPKAKPLTAAEARVLLTASADWHRPLPSSDQTEVRTADHGTLTRMPTQGEPSRVSRELELVDPAQLEQFPCNTIACLDIIDESLPYRGSGFLVSPYCVLTAGHNVYWEDHWVDSITVIPAQHTSNNGYSIIKPYGDQYCPTRALHSNFRFIQETDDINISEFDYGAILLDHPFSGIDTFMPLEFHYPGQDLPYRTEVAGYPLYPDDTEIPSDDPWRANGLTYDSPDGTYQQFINFTIPVFGGDSGSPICYQNLLGQTRVIGITTWRNLYTAGGGGILLTSMNEELIRSWLTYTPTSDFEHTSYIPYFSNQAGSWTGLALANPNSATCQAHIEYFAADGKPVGSQYVEIGAGCQAAFACSPNQDPYCAAGWLKISTTQPVYGLALIGQGSPSSMFDMGLKTSLHKKLLFPHVAAAGDWHSTVMICNPDRETDCTLTLTWLQSNGTPVTGWSTIPAGGSRALDLENFFQQPLPGGQLRITASRPVAAFLLYDNIDANSDQNMLWRAGLSANPLDETE